MYENFKVQKMANILISFSNDNFYLQVIPNEIFISQKHIEKAFNSTVPSLSVSDVERYKYLYSKFLNQDENKRAHVPFDRKQGQRTTLA